MWRLVRGVRRSWERCEYGIGITHWVWCIKRRKELGFGVEDDRVGFDAAYCIHGMPYIIDRRYDAS